MLNNLSMLGENKRENCVHQKMSWLQKTRETHPHCSKTRKVCICNFGIEYFIHIATISHFIVSMARGNQREVSREKNLAKQAQKLKQQGKVCDDMRVNGYFILLVSYIVFEFIQKEGNPLARNLNDSAALAAKIAAKQAKLAQEQASGQAPVKVERKKIPKSADPSLDDLLNAGLTKGKKIK